MKKGQVSIEFMIIVGIILVLMIPVIWYAFSIISYESGETNAIAKAYTAVGRVVHLSDSVGATGTGSAIYTEIIVPNYVTGVKVEDREFYMQLQTSNGPTDIVGISKFQLVADSADLDRLNRTGTYKIHIHSINNTHVGVEVV